MDSVKNKPIRYLHPLPTNHILHLCMRKNVLPPAEQSFGYQNMFPLYLKGRKQALQNPGA